jgi:hypothetical protein
MTVFEKGSRVVFKEFSGALWNKTAGVDSGRMEPFEVKCESAARFLIFEKPSRLLLN